jgi:hypothetical protein
VLEKLPRQRRKAAPDNRQRYLQDWIPPDTLTYLERLLNGTEKLPPPLRDLVRLSASDLIRDYSYQEPADLRIRRRRTPLPVDAFPERLAAGIERVLAAVEAAQGVAGWPKTEHRVLVADSSDALDLAADEGPTPDCAITSPPYAMALPYIDTQRISLVWLSLLDPKELAPTEAALTGSRELRSSAKSWAASLATNGGDLPEAQHGLCQQLQAALSTSDGFRRKSVPPLLYRYFVQMRDMFVQVRKSLPAGAPYALLIGHNHTTLGGTRFDIDTPAHLAELADAVGWRLDEAVPLQTYQRYGMHAKNAVQAETLLLLRAT